MAGQAFKGNFHDVMIIQELITEDLQIEVWPGVDLAKLTAGDPDPRFIQLPIAEIDATSGNKRFYDREFILELERQAAANKPIGIMGHLTQEQRGSAFPAEAVHWIGARWKGNQLIGKAYVPPGEARGRIARYEATSKKIATSIDAWAEGVWDEAKKVTRMLAKSLKLNQIDIAPADRAGIGSLAAVPTLATEMDDSERDPTMNEAERIKLITELTPDDRKYVPAQLVNAIQAEVPPAPEAGLVTELRQVIGVDDKADLKAAITELVTTRDAARKTAIITKITELATPAPAQGDKPANEGIKLEPIRGLVIEMVASRNPATPEAAATVYQEVINSDHVKAALKSHVVQEMGPNQGAQNQGAQQPKEGNFIKIPARKEVPTPK